MNPLQVAVNRTARLLAEAKTPVYSTTTPKREHHAAVEIESTWGRAWFHMLDSEVDQFVRDHDKEDVMWLSDIDHSAKCWCQ